MLLAAGTSALPAARLTAWRARAGTMRRFQEGSFDSVSFLGADVGLVASLMVAPQQGSWGLDEVIVSSSQAGSRQERRWPSEIPCNSDRCGALTSRVEGTEVRGGRPLCPLASTVHPAGLLHRQR